MRSIFVNRLDCSLGCFGIKPLFTMLHSHVLIHIRSAAFYLFWSINTISYWIYNFICVVAEIKNDYLIYVFEQRARTHLIHLCFAQRHSAISVLSLPSAFPILLKNNKTLDGVLDKHITNYKEYGVYHSAQSLQEY